MNPVKPSAFNHVRRRTIDEDTPISTPTSGNLSPSTDPFKRIGPTIMQILKAKSPEGSIDEDLLEDQQKPIPFWKQLLLSITRPDPAEITEEKLSSIKARLRETHKANWKLKQTQRIKKRKRQAKRIKNLALSEKSLGSFGPRSKLTSQGTISSSALQSRSSTLRSFTSVSPFAFVSKDSEGVFPRIDSQKSRSTSLPQSNNLSVNTSMSTRISIIDSIRSDNSKLSSEQYKFLHFIHDQRAEGSATHISMPDTRLDKHASKTFRRVSKFTGEHGYHHSLAVVWDHQGSKWHKMLDKEIRKKYPITHEIKEKVEKIMERNTVKARKKAKKSTHCKGLRKFGHMIFDCMKKSHLGEVIRSTPRYYKLTPEVPQLCRRCRYPLKDTMEAHWTPVGIVFAIMFPIFGLLCCISYREFVCVVCEEIYVHGDYPSRCKPKEKTNEDSTYNRQSRSAVIKHF